MSIGRRVLCRRGHHCYRHWPKQTASDYRCANHAYALMTNHVHLLVTPDHPDGLSRLMQSVGRRYVQHVNRTHKRTGTLWEGRFKSSVVHEADYFLMCSRYIELNPVRADMVADPGQYRWSSYRHNGLGQPDERLTPHAEYLALGQQGQDRCEVYRNLFRTELDEAAIRDIRFSLAQGQPLGNTRFSKTPCVAAGIRRTQAKRGRPTRSPAGKGGFGGNQMEFGLC